MFDEEISGVAEAALRTAEKRGLDEANIRVETNIFASIDFVNGRVVSAVTGVERGIGVRTFYKGAFGFSYANSLSRDSILEVVEGSARVAKYVSTKSKEEVQLAPHEPHKDRIIEEAARDPSEVSFEEKIDLASRVHDAARKYDERISSVRVLLSDSSRSHVTATTSGAFIEYYRPLVTIVLMVVATEFGRRGSYVKRIGFVGGYEKLTDEEIENLVKLCCEKAIVQLKAKPAPSGKFTAVLDSELTGVFVHEAVGHACEADSVVAGRSVLANKLGQSIASELVTIVDDSTISGRWGALKYDDEGVKTTKRVLIDKGVLRTYINNLETSWKLNVEPNGGARAESYAHPPIVRMSVTYMQPGDSTFEELIEDIKRGVYLRGSRGGQVDPAKGTFQFNAKEAYLIENGEITVPLLDVSMSGLTLETLKNVVAVGKDFELGVGFCGKMGQRVPVCDGGPPLKVKELVIGGRA